MTTRGARILMLLVLLATSGVARADRTELYTVLGYEAGASHYLVPVAGSGAATCYAGALDVSVYYGITEALHLGGRLRLTSSSDVHFTGTTVRSSDGTESPGDLYVDHRALGLGALLLYRVDTGFSLAPVVELEGGFTVHEYKNIAHIPAGEPYSTQLADVSEAVLHGSATLLLEYRFTNRWIIAAGVGVQVEPQGLTPWSIVVPLRLGRIW